MTQFCALCDVLGERPRQTANTIGLSTARPEIIAHARERFDTDHSDAVHVVVAVCPEHVVEVYRGRVAGVSMAWRIASIPS
ncbi:MAG: hypothetical protein ACRDHF_04155 [Tepidiformaceae bacterium]